MQGIKIYTILASSLISGSIFAQTEISANSSTVNASYVEPSAEKIISPNDKLNNLLKKCLSLYILQKNWRENLLCSTLFYSTTFYVGDKGVCCLMLRRVAVNIYYRQFVMYSITRNSAGYSHYYGSLAIVHFGTMRRRKKA